MPLVLEIEHLLGIAFAAREPADDVPDWPPQPDRVFSALVASWAARGERPAEREALLWLEAQPCPDIAASGGLPRTAPIVFVLPNDPESHKVADPKIMPALRQRQARRFPAFRPEDPVVSLVWRDTVADSDVLGALNALAADTAYIGHSASLTRCRFYEGKTPASSTSPRRRVYPGRLAELEQRFHERPPQRPKPGEPVRPSSDRIKPVPASIFADRWLVLEHVAGDMPDLRAAPLVARALRKALMSGYAQSFGEAAIPPAVSGHNADGSPLRDAHLAIVPLAFLGMAFADGQVFGFALVPPGDGALLDDLSFQSAVKAIAPWNGARGRRELELKCDGFHLTFTPSGEGTRRSLDPEPYIGVARRWASCTPIALDRHLKEKGNEARDVEMRGLIAQACRNIGLPAPVAIAAGKHSAMTGAPSAYPSGGAPRWTAWRLPTSLASRQLTHAVLEFAEPVRGPVMLGAGRFVGLGLCRAIRKDR